MEEGLCPFAILSGPRATRGPRIGPVGADFSRGVDVRPDSGAEPSLRTNLSGALSGAGGVVVGKNGQVLVSGSTGNCSTAPADPTAQTGRQPAAITASAVSRPSVMPTDVVICSFGDSFMAQPRAGPSIFLIRRPAL